MIATNSPSRTTRLDGPQRLDGELADSVDLADVGELDDTRAGVTDHHGSSAAELAWTATRSPAWSPETISTLLLLASPSFTLRVEFLAVRADHRDGRVVLVVLETASIGTWTTSLAWATMMRTLTFMPGRGPWTPFMLTITGNVTTPSLSVPVSAA